MKNILIFAGIAGLAAAISIYFVTESNKNSDQDDFLTDVDYENYDFYDNTGEPVAIS